MPSKASLSSRRSRIAEDWQPSNDDRAFADSLGVDIDREAPAFLDWHLMHGSLMMDWHAAWRTWCRKAVQFGRATGQRALPLLAVAASADRDDPYGARAWARTLPDAAPDRMPDGSTALCVGGFDVAATAADMCRAAGLAPEWRGSLAPVADWLRLGVDPEAMLAVIRRGGRASVVRSLAYFDAAIREGAVRHAG